MLSHLHNGFGLYSKGIGKSVLPLMLFGIVALCSVFYVNTGLDLSLQPRNIIWCAGTFLLFFMCVLFCGDKEVDVSFITNPVFIFLFLFFFMALLSGQNAINKGEYLYEVLKYFLLIVFTIICVPILKNEYYRKIFITHMAVLTPVMIIAGLIITKDLNGFGTMSNKNLWAGSVLLMAVFSFMSYKWYGTAVISSIGLALVVFVIALSKTRSAWVSLFMFGICFVNSWKRFFFVVFASLLIMSALVWYHGDDIIKTETVQSRYYLAKSTIEMVEDKEAASFGVGAGNWVVSIPPYISDFFTDEFGKRPSADIVYTRAHNDFVEIYGETGFFGLFFFGLAILAAMIQGVESKNKIIFAGIVMWCTQAMFSFPMERPFTLIILGILLALTIAVSGRFEIPVTVNRNVLSAYTMILAVGLTFCCYDFWQRMSTEEYTKRILHHRANNKPQMVIDEYNNNYTWLSSLDATSKPIKFYKGEAEHIIGQDKSALISFLQAEKAHPNNIVILANISSLYYLMGELETAKQYNDRVLKICPSFEIALLNRVRIAEAISQK